MRKTKKPPYRAWVLVRKDGFALQHIHSTRKASLNFLKAVRADNPDLFANYKPVSYIREN